MSEASSLIPVVVDGEHREVEPEVTGVQLFESDKNIIAVRINGQPRDLYTPLHAGDTVESIALDSEDGLAIMRHSATHVMAQARYRPCYRRWFLLRFWRGAPFHTG